MSWMGRSIQSSEAAGMASKWQISLPIIQFMTQRIDTFDVQGK